MRNLFFSVSLMFLSTSFSSQSKEELDKTMRSVDPLTIADFIKKYPQDANVPFLKRKIQGLKEKSYAVLENKKPTSEGKEKKRSAQDVLNHIFNNDPKKPDAYLQIKNASDCDINVKIEGKKTYFMTVPKMKDNFIILPKGNYNISTDLCGAFYSSLKNINQDIQINLSAPKKVRN